MCSTLVTGWVPTIMRAGRGMMLYSKATSDPPPEKLELFSYENNQVMKIFWHVYEWIKSRCNHVHRHPWPCNSAIPTIIFTLLKQPSAWDKRVISHYGVFGHVECLSSWQTRLWRAPLFCLVLVSAVCKIGERDFMWIGATLHSSKCGQGIILQGLFA